MTSGRGGGAPAAAPRGGCVRRGGRRQRGVGSVLLLLFVLLIVMVALGTILRHGAPTTSQDPAVRAGAKEAAATAESAPAAAPASGLQAPLEKARSLEETMREQAIANDRKIDQAVDSAAR